MIAKSHFIFHYNPLVADVEVDLYNGEKLAYQTRIQNLEEALVLKAFARKERGAGKDLADFHTLIATREAHPEAPWRLNAPNPIGFRKDAVHVLQPLVKALAKKRTPFPAPATVDKRRFAVLVSRHCAPQ